MHTILRQLRRAALLSVGDGPSDAQLLESFLNQRDEAAFEALVRRHGPMVLGVCRRVTGNAHDAEDAFQATFLVLVRKAASLRSRQLLPGWLSGVAYRTALKTRAMTRKRRTKEQQAAQQPSSHASDDHPPEELLARLDEELNRLPDRYRLPVVLCELQGHSRRQAAQLLDLPVGTVSWRLAHARKLLAQRLARYGTMLSAGTVAAVLSQNAALAVPAALVRAVTMQALATATIPAPIQTLTEGVLKAMLLSKLKIVWGAALAVVVGAGAVGLMYRPAAAADPTQPGRTGARARASQDELEEMRLEIAALRKGLQATRERVSALEDEVARLRTPRQGGPATRGGHTADADWGNQVGGFGTFGTSQSGSAGSAGAAPGSTGGGFGGFGGFGGRAFGGGGSAGGPVGVIGRDTGKANGRGGPTMRWGRSGSTTGPRMPGSGSASADMEGAMSGGWGSSSSADGRAGSAATGTAGGSRPAESTAPETRRGEQRRAVGEVREGTSAPSIDPLAAAQAALRQLRRHPNDRRAADRLEGALKRLEAERKKPQSGGHSEGPAS